MALRELTGRRPYYVRSFNQRLAKLFRMFD